MTFFNNKTLNLLNAHYGLRAIGWEMASLFTLAYLYKQGLSLTQTFLVYAFFLFMRTVTRPFARYLCTKKGIHFTLCAGTCVFACRYLALILVDGLSWKLIVPMVISGAADSLYWVAYHTYFSVIGDEETRGASVGVREAMTTIISIIAPVCGGALLAVDKTLAFVFPAVLTFLSLIPLSKTPQVPTPKALTRQEKRAVEKTGFWIFIGDGLFWQAERVWPIIVFMMLGDNYNNFGLLLGLAAVFRAIGNMFFGRMIDKGKGLCVCCVGYGIHMITAATRGIFARTIPVVIACDFMSAIGMCFSLTGIMTAVYNTIKHSKHPMDCTFYTELGWDVGAISAMLCAASLAACGINIRWIMAASVAGSVLSLSLLYGYYKARGKAKAAGEAA